MYMMHIFGATIMNNTEILLLYKNNIDIIASYCTERSETFLYFSQYGFETNLISIKRTCTFLFYFVQRINIKMYFTYLHYCNLFSIHSSFIIRVTYFPFCIILIFLFVSLIILLIV